MKIAIDASQIIYGTGVSLYTKKLIENLLKIDSNDEYIIFGGSLRRMGDLKNIFESLKGLNSRNKAVWKVYPISPAIADYLWNKLHVLPIEKIIGRVDVFHSSDWAEPPSKAFKVTTVHDLIPLKFPKLVHRRILETHLRKLSWVKKESARIIVPSESTKSDLMAYGVSEERIRVISEAGILKKASQESIDEIKEKYKISGDYLLAFASGPYKNIQRIKKAYEMATAGKNLKLVVVGRQSVNLIKEDRNVRLTGYVKEDELAALLTGSRGLIFASLYEGFGQPILEAFSCEVPVVTSNLGSMREVAGEAAALVDPKSEISISEGIEAIIRGPKKFIEKGKKRVKDFSWEKTAAETLKIYKE